MQVAQPERTISSGIATEPPFAELLVVYSIGKLQHSLSYLPDTTSAWKKLLFDISAAQKNSCGTEPVSPNPTIGHVLINECVQWLDMLHVQQQNLPTFDYLLTANRFLPDSRTQRKRKNTPANSISTRVLLNFEEKTWLSQTILTANFAEQILEQKTVLLSSELKEFLQKLLLAREFALERFITANMGLVYFFTEKYFAGNSQFEDFVQEGRIGLQQAAQKFDYRKGTFSTYAATAIKRRIISSYRRHKEARESVALEQPLYDEENSDELGDTLIDPSAHSVEDDVDTQLLLGKIKHFLDTIPPREQEILMRKLIGKETYEQIGKAVKLSSGRVRQLFKQLYPILRAAIS